MARWRMTGRVAVVLLALLLLSFAPRTEHAVLAQDGQTMVTIKPVSGTYAVGDTIAVEVWIEDVEDLYGADVRLRFNPSRFTVQDADLTQPGVQITPRADLLSPDIVVKKEADNAAGTVWYAVSQLNPRPPASGSGAICSFTLQVLSGWNGDLTIHYHKLSDKNAEEIESAAQDASYTLEGTGYLFLPLIYR